MKLKISESQCDCNKCSLMCHAPCCGTPDDMKALIQAGLGPRLMHDDLPGGADMIKPALKGYEGKKSPWNTFSFMGCTFWKKGKCELHDLGLKPLQGKLSHHTLTEDENRELGEFVNESWETLEEKEFDDLIETWKLSCSSRKVGKI